MAYYLKLKAAEKVKRILERKVKREISFFNVIFKRMGNVNIKGFKKVEIVP